MRGFKVVLQCPDGSLRWYVTWDYRGRSEEQIAIDESEELKRKGSQDVVMYVEEIDPPVRF